MKLREIYDEADRSYVRTWQAVLFGFGVGVLGFFFGSLMEYSTHHPSGNHPPEHHAPGAVLKNELDIVCIEWLDAKGDMGWMTVEDYDPMAPMVTCGHLVQENESFFILALDRAMDEGDPITYNQIGSVPRGMITRTRRLK